MQFALIDPRVLIKNPWNPNEISPDAEIKLKKSLERDGHLKPILVREVDAGLEIVGGAHRVDLSIEIGMDEVPTLNLGRISDEQAKRALIFDNARYGEDDAVKLSELLSDLGDAESLSEWLNMDVTELELLVGVSDADDMSLLDSLDTIDDEEGEDEYVSPVREIQTHQQMKFKVPKEDSEFVADVIASISRELDVSEPDSQIRSGDAILWLCRQYQKDNLSTSGDSDFEPLEDLDLEV